MRAVIIVFFLLTWLPAGESRQAIGLFQPDEIETPLDTLVHLAHPRLADQERKLQDEQAALDSRKTIAEQNAKDDQERQIVAAEYQQKNTVLSNRVMEIDNQFTVLRSALLAEILDREFPDHPVIIRHPGDDGSGQHVIAKSRHPVEDLTPRLKRVLADEAALRIKDQAVEADQKKR